MNDLITSGILSIISGGIISSRGISQTVSTDPDACVQAKDVEALRQRLEQERLQQVADRESLNKEVATVRNEWDTLSFQRATATDANSKVQHEMQQIRTLAEELEGRARYASCLMSHVSRTCSVCGGCCMAPLALCAMSWLHVLPHVRLLYLVPLTRYRALVCT